MKIFVDNLSFRATARDLRQAFEMFGQVISARIVMNIDTGRPRGFAVVDMVNETEAKAAIQGLNGKEVFERIIEVGEARVYPDPREFGLPT